MVDAVLVRQLDDVTTRYGSGVDAIAKAARTKLGVVGQFGMNRLAYD